MSRFGSSAQPYYYIHQHISQARCLMNTPHLKQLLLPWSVFSLDRDSRFFEPFLYHPKSTTMGFLGRLRGEQKGNPKDPINRNGHPKEATAKQYRLQKKPIQEGRSRETHQHAPLKEPPFQAFISPKVPNREASPRKLVVHKPGLPQAPSESSHPLEIRIQHKSLPQHSIQESRSQESYRVKTSLHRIYSPEHNTQKSSVVHEGVKNSVHSSSPPKQSSSQRVASQVIQEKISRRKSTALEGARVASSSPFPEIQRSHSTSQVQKRDDEGIEMQMGVMEPIAQTLKKREALPWIFENAVTISPQVELEEQLKKQTHELEQTRKELKERELYWECRVDNLEHVMAEQYRNDICRVKEQHEMEIKTMASSMKEHVSHSEDYFRNSTYGKRPPYGDSENGGQSLRRETQQQADMQVKISDLQGSHHAQIQAIERQMDLELRQIMKDKEATTAKLQAEVNETKAVMNGTRATLATTATSLEEKTRTLDDTRLALNRTHNELNINSRQLSQVMQQECANLQQRLNTIITEMELLKEERASQLAQMTLRFQEAMRSEYIEDKERQLTELKAQFSRLREQIASCRFELTPNSIEMTVGKENQ
ncbi:hypothetical protein BGZ60DRAFT_528251 [Tricladium varicosporioides]|nr:hypothetical protein BGZ60DRAFT_528251 [Hymenoscyphus varicosporioides]